MSNPCTGGCLCGAVRYAFAPPVLWSGYCHCNSCRRNTGAVVACFIGLRPAQLQMLQGQCKQFESSAGVSRGFCEQCGTPISYMAERWPNEIHLYVGTLDEPERFPPRFHVYCEEQLSWFNTTDTLVRHQATSLDNT